MENKTLQELEIETKAIQKASELLYRDIKKNQDDFLYIYSIFWKAFEKHKGECVLNKKVLYEKYNHSRMVTQFLEWLFEGIENDTIEIVEKKCKTQEIK